MTSYDVLSSERVNNEAPEYISITCTHILPRAIPTVGTVSLVFLGQRQTYSKQVIIAFSDAFLWSNFPLTGRACHSLSFCKRIFCARLEALHEIDCDINLLRREQPDKGETERRRGFGDIALAVLGHSKPSF